MARPLAERLHVALAGDGSDLDAVVADGLGRVHDRHEEARALAEVHDLHLAPIDDVGVRCRFQHHPAVAALKTHLETRLLTRIDEALAGGTGDPVALDGPGPGPGGDADAVAQLRAIAAAGLVPPLYRWLATRASFPAVRRFLAVEGGPDGGFDDLVAVCQVGLAGAPKLELATNYWDEMGRGRAADVHTELHRQLSQALPLTPVPRQALPVAALERSLLGSTLATNRWLQPELVGALGLIELQAGPRCRQVVAALERVEAPAGALPFYREHAVADPRHGRDWLDHVVGPLVEDEAWAAGIVRGARWRAVVDTAFQRWAWDDLGAGAEDDADADDAHVGGGWAEVGAAAGRG